jgi:hypothetical protein
LVAKIALKGRIGFSLTAVGFSWLLSGIAFSIYCRDFVPFSLADLTGWPAFGAAIGATAMLFYSWLLSRYVSLTKKGS